MHRPLPTLDPGQDRAILVRNLSRLLKAGLSMRAATLRVLDTAGLDRWPLGGAGRATPARGS